MSQDRGLPEKRYSTRKVRLAGGGANDLGVVAGGDATGLDGVAAARGVPGQALAPCM